MLSFIYLPTTFIPITVTTNSPKDVELIFGIIDDFTANNQLAFTAIFSSNKPALQAVEVLFATLGCHAGRANLWPHLTR